MILHFDSRLFLHALYVGIVYSCLAFGATYYRKIADDLEVRKLSMGEEIFSTYSPLALLGIAAFTALFCIFAVVALLQENPHLIVYVLPVACGINVLQFILRARHQRVMIKSKGVVVRYLFKEGGIGIGYGSLSRVEARKFGSWYVVRFIGDKEKTFAICHLRNEMFQHIHAMVRMNPECRVVVEE